MKNQLRPALDGHEGKSSQRPEKVQTGSVAGDEQVLPVVHLRPRCPVGEGVGSASQKRLLLEEKNGNGTAGEGDRCGKSAQSAANNDDGVHRAWGSGWTGRHRANQEYLSWWLSQ